MPAYLFTLEVVGLEWSFTLFCFMTHAISSRATATVRKHR